MAAPYRLLKLRRGLKADLPVLAEGELGYSTDTKELFIGSDAGNQLISVYIAAVPANWDGTPPVTVQDALDRIAAALSTETGVPIA